MSLYHLTRAAIDQPLARSSWPPPQRSLLLPPFDAGAQFVRIVLAGRFVVGHGGPTPARKRIDLNREMEPGGCLRLKAAVVARSRLGAG